MPDLAYGTSAHIRDRGNFPELPVVNMIVESVISEANPVLQSRAGLENSGITMGSGPVKALFQTDGVLSNGLFGVSGGNLYSSGTSIGAINGSGVAKIDGFETNIYITQGSSLYTYNGTTLTAVTVPDTFATLDLCVGASRLIIIKTDTGRFYWSDVLTSTIGALSFATAENSPDKCRACLYIGDTLILFGAETVEFWQTTTDSTSPFQPIIGRVFPVGIKSTGCATAIGPTFAWVTNHNQICLGDLDRIISFPGLEAKIEASASHSLYTFRHEGTEFLALRLATETWIYSLATSQWSTFASDGQTNWIPQCFTGGYFGSAIDGRLVRWASNHEDFGGILERKFRAGANVTNGTISAHNITLRTNAGSTPYTTGSYTNPVVQMRTSKDGGFNWSAWRSRALGVQGDRRELTQWRSLGYFSNPGLLVEFRVTDPVPFRVAAATINEKYGNI